MKTHGDPLVKRCLDYIDLLDVPGFIENPFTGHLKNRQFMKARAGEPSEVTYCKYFATTDPCCPPGATCALCELRGRYEKSTGIWSMNMKKWVPQLQPCKPKSRCKFCEGNGGKRHPEACPPGAKAYPVPGRLIKELLQHLFDQL